MLWMTNDNGGWSGQCKMNFMWMFIKFIQDLWTKLYEIIFCFTNYLNLNVCLPTLGQSLDAICLALCAYVTLNNMWIS
jgi:hypothetical protein